MESKACCNRRELLRRAAQGGVALGFMGASLPQLFSLREARAGVAPEGALYDAALSIFMDGGPSQQDSLDPKPGSRCQGPFGSFSLGFQDVYGQAVRLTNPLAPLGNLVTNPGSNVRLGLIRSLSHDNGDHEFAQNYMNSFWGGAPAATEYPSIASAMAYFRQGEGIGIPSVVIGPEKTLTNRGPNLSRCPAPLVVTAGDAQSGNPVVRSLELPVDQARYGRRKAFTDALNARFLRRRPDALARDWERSADDAYGVTVGGQAARAFDLTGVPLLPAADANTARRLTLAARLLDAGVPWVATGILGNDSHENNAATVQANWGTSVAQGVGGLCQQLAASGKRVLVVVYGDFGRTPDTVDPNGANRDGRDHWPDGFSVGLLSINQPRFTPTAIGDTGPDGLWTRADGRLRDPIGPGDLGAFIYKALGFQVGRFDGRYDVPMADREAPPVDRNNEGDELLRTFGLA